MRTLIAIIACSFAAATASANEPQPKPAAAPDSAPRNEIPLSPSARNPGVKGVQAIRTAAAAQAAPAGASSSSSAAASAPARKLSEREREQQAEAELSARIAERLAIMRANQAARVAQQAKAKKAAAAAEAASAAAAAAAAAKPKVYSDRWSYEGDTGPAHWGEINPAWAKCGSGNRQSPIDIRDGMKVDLEQIVFDYHPSSFNVTDNGHTVQVMVGGGNYLTVQNRTYELVQFHFHRPSEERINGKMYEMVVHLVHKDLEGKIAMLSVPLERGRQQPVVQTVWNNLPLEKFDTLAPNAVLDPMELLPQRRDYYTYMGSLTTPPCTEGVLWMVMKEPVQASPAQMALFARLYPMNARPPQPGNGRIIKESN
ncbi:carbonic anhydrase [Oxalobacteraceae bacterium A2-2]